MTVTPKLAKVFDSVPAIIRVTKRRDDGSHKLDWNLVVELAVKIVTLATVVWTAKVASHNSKMTEGNRAVLEEQYSSNYVQEVINQRSQDK